MEIALDRINNSAASCGVLYVIPDLIRYSVFFLDSVFRRCEGNAASLREYVLRDSILFGKCRLRYRS
jgi:hypothetical protein